MMGGRVGWRMGRLALCGMLRSVVSREFQRVLQQQVLQRASIGVTVWRVFRQVAARWRRYTFAFAMARSKEGALARTSPQGVGASATASEILAADTLRGHVRGSSNIKLKTVAELRCIFPERCAHGDGSVRSISMITCLLLRVLN